ncbi:MAG: heme exporter protein CcmB [Pseudomonadota bacterium]
MKGALAILLRELRLALRTGGGAGQGLAFFIVFVLLVPFGSGPEPERLEAIGPGALWLAALLASLLSLDRLFHNDHEDGTLDILATSPMPLEGLVAIKGLAHWLTTGLPLIGLAPVLAIALYLPLEAFGTLALSLALGTPGLSFLGTIGGAVTVGLRRGGLLLSILVLPLFVPTLIFGARAVANAAAGQDPTPALLLLGGVTLFVLALAPFAAAAALKVNMR